MPIITLAPKPEKIMIDPQPYVEQLLACRPGIAETLQRLVMGHGVLQRLSIDSVGRGAAEKHWERLAIQMHSQLRTAYRYLALICTVNPPLGWQAWDDVIGSHRLWERAGLENLLRYWREREAPAWHWTDQDYYALTKAKVPAEFDPSCLLPGMK